jgi:radical SAM superfamily enzyme YgiQ (UPF0313 family)
MAGKNILMVYPKIPQNTYWSYSHSIHFMNKKAPLPPLGLATIAAMVPKGYDVKIVDMNVQELDKRDLEWADIFFTSSMVVQKESLESLINKLKPWQKPIVAGGPYPTQYYDEIEGIDHYILGEAESGVLNQYFKDEKTGNAKRVYANVVIRKRAGEQQIDEQNLENMLRFFDNDSRIEVVNSRPDLSLSPVPRFDLLKTEDYMSMAVQWTRGCPYHCEFCNEGTLFGHQTRLKLNERIIEEFERIYELGFHNPVFVVDDNVIGNKRKTKQILPAVTRFQKKHGYPFGWYTEGDISASKDPELLEMMRDAGCNMLFVGLESPETEVLRKMGKHQNVKINLGEGVREIQSKGIEVTAGFIVGNDSDSDDCCDKIFDFCSDNGIVTAMVGLLTAVKGSELYERLKREGRLRRDSGGNNTHNFSLNFEPLPGKDERKIISDYKNLLSRLYDKNGENYFNRCSKLLKRLGPSPKPGRNVGFTEIKALLKSIWVQSRAPYNRAYRQYMLQSLRYPKKFAKAAHMAISGEHFIKITHHSLEVERMKEELIEKSEYYHKKIEEAGRNGMFKKIQKETQKFLRNTARKIEKMPASYRDKLMENYRQMAEGMAALLIKYQTSTI